MKVYEFRNSENKILFSLKVYFNVTCLVIALFYKHAVCVLNLIQSYFTALFEFGGAVD